MPMRTPLSALLLVPSVLLFGCTPHDAEVEGTWFAWLPKNSSPSIASGSFENPADGATIFECARGWDDEAGDWDPNYIGPRTAAEFEEARYIGGDCPRYQDGVDDRDRPVYVYESWCTEPRDAHEGKSVVDEIEEECDRVTGLDFHDWLGSDGYFASKAPIDAWRSSALINGEGDFQLAVHTDLGNGNDFRFQFSIDPDFAPVTCTTDEAGDPLIAYIDDAPWLEKWSEDEDGYTIYYLNAGSFQVFQGATSGNASSSLPSDWNSGFGYGKFGDDEMISEANAYGNTDEEGEGPVFTALEISERPEPDLDLYTSRADELRTNSDAWAREMSEVAGAFVGDAADPSYRFTHKVEDNIWRPVDTTVAGLDAWMEVATSWVRIKNTGKVEVGGSVEGDFQILLHGYDSETRVVVQGTFKVEEIKEDKYAYPVLEDERRGLKEFDGHSFCDGAPGPN
jgi:hypothetical protein